MIEPDTFLLEVLCFTAFQIFLISQIGTQDNLFFCFSEGHIWKVHQHCYPLPQCKLRTQKVHEHCIPLCNIDLDMLLIFETQKSSWRHTLCLWTFNFKPRFWPILPPHSPFEVDLTQFFHHLIPSSFVWSRLDISWNQTSGTLICCSDLGSACSSNNYQMMTGLMIWLRLIRLSHNLISL